MIPVEAVEAAAKYLSDLMADPDGNYTVEATDLLEAAAPHMASNLGGREEIEERVKAIVQDVAMTVDYTDRLHNAVQEIMTATIG